MVREFWNDGNRKGKETVPAITEWLLNAIWGPRLVMSITEIMHIGGGQAVRLPEEFQFDSESVSIRREGESVILEPVKPATWPEGFFEAIRIDDPKFVRTDQGRTPPVPPLD